MFIGCPLAGCTCFCAFGCSISTPLALLACLLAVVSWLYVMAGPSKHLLSKYHGPDSIACSRNLCFLEVAVFTRVELHWTPPLSLSQVQVGLQ